MSDVGVVCHDGPNARDVPHLPPRLTHHVPEEVSPSHPLMFDFAGHYVATIVPAFLRDRIFGLDRHHELWAKSIDQHHW